MRRNVSIIRSLDWFTIIIYVMLVFMGWLNIYAAVYNEEHSSILDATQKYGKQLMWIGAAFILAIIILIVESKFYSVFAHIIYMTTILLLVSVLILGKEVNGARSWFELGPVRFQPAEFAKFATCLAIAKYMSKFGFKIMDFKSLITAGAIIFIPAALIILQNDTGSALVYSVFILVMYRQGLPGIFIFLCFLTATLFILALVFSELTVLLCILCGAILAFKIYRNNNKEIIFTTGITTGLFLLGKGLCWLFEYALSNYELLLYSFAISIPLYLFFIYKNKIRYGLIILLLAVGSIGFTSSVEYVFNNILEAHQSKRIKILLGIESDPYGDGYNVAQSKIAIGSGGFAGKGFLKGTQTKFDFVPEQSTDFIFCTVGEEWGFMGTSFIITMFIILILRLIYLSERQRSSFSRIYGYGVACILFFHLAINVGMTIGIAPVIGIPLPFFSYGGSSLWSFTILIFIFLRLDANRLELFG